MIKCYNTTMLKCTKRKNFTKCTECTKCKKCKKFTKRTKCTKIRVFKTLKSSKFCTLAFKYPTLTYLIKGHARLLIFENFSTLDVLIRACPFINIG